MTSPKKLNQPRKDPFARSKERQQVVEQAREEVRQAYTTMVQDLPVPDPRIRMDAPALLVAWQHGFRMGMSGGLEAAGVPSPAAAEEAGLIAEEVMADRYEITTVMNEVIRNVLVIQGFEQPHV